MHYVIDITNTIYFVFVFWLLGVDLYGYRGSYEDIIVPIRRATVRAGSLFSVSNDIQAAAFPIQMPIILYFSCHS